MQNSKIPLNVKQPAKKQATNTKTLSAGNMLYPKGHHNTKTPAAKHQTAQAGKITPSYFCKSIKTQKC